MIAIVHAPALIGFGVGLAISRALTAAARNLSFGNTLQWLRQLRQRMPFTAVTASSVDWARNQRDQDAVTYFMKPLFRDPRSGQTVMLVRYPPGQINPAHSHPVGHGMYVLQGSLVTHRGTFGPNTLVWFPPGEVMWHGAGPDDELIALFMVGRNFSTRYVRRDPTSPGSPAE